ncbi:MAG: ATP-binding protein [Bifidobacteriaceae bacterium]|jgi:hypothetical protein|nr:ATP-binding protein [Bifidobacteriaceae bacterium]
MTASNPFKPTFGTAPPELIGRNQVIEDIHDGILEGVGSPLRAVLLTGPRGTGKTVLLDAARQAAEREQWVTVEVSGAPGMLRSILDGTRVALGYLLDSDKVHLGGIGIGPVSLQLNRDVAPELSWPYQMNRLLELLAEHGTGLMVTVDEVTPALSEMRDLALTFQHWVREEREVALIMAGLPTGIEGLLTEESLTFLQRAERYDLGHLEIKLVAKSYKAIFAAAGRRATPEAIEAAANARAGYPFLVQLIGYYAWKAGGDTIDANTVSAAAAKARRSMASRIHQAALKDTSDVDRRVLNAMAQDAGPSWTRRLAERLDVSPQYLDTYRNRLLTAGLVIAPRRGYLDYAIPYMREYLRAEQAE